MYENWASKELNDHWGSFFFTVGMKLKQNGRLHEAKLIKAPTKHIKLERNKM